MATTSVATVEVELDKVRTLRMDLNALADFENVTGRSILRDGIDPSTMKIGDLRALLWACCVQEDESLTQQQVGSWLDLTNLKPVTSAIMSLFKRSMPDAKPPEEEAEFPLELREVDPPLHSTSGQSE